MTGNIIVETARTKLVLLDASQAGLMRDYYLKNKAYLSNWEPVRDNSFYEINTWQELLNEGLQLFYTGSAIKLAVLNHSQTHVIGVCNFTNIIRGVFQACNLGYSIDEDYQGQGYMHEVLNAAMAYVFDEVGLHRVMANYVPENHKSAAVLQRLGFEKEGLAKSYLKINGEWRVHVLTSKINTKE